MRSLSSLKEGAIFRIKELLLDKSEFCIEEIGGASDMELLKKDLFGFLIVRCRGVKYAINNVVADKISVLQC